MAELLAVKEQLHSAQEEQVASAVRSYPKDPLSWLL
jgi:hypothetical protein